MNSLLKKHRKERDKALKVLQEAQARYDEAERVVQEDENTEIVAVVRALKLGPEELAALLKGLRANGGVPFPLEQEESINEQEEQTNEQAE